MEKRYAALRIVGTIYRVLGGLVALVTVLMALVLCLSIMVGGASLGSLGSDEAFAGVFGGVVGGLIISAVMVLYGGAVAVTLFAVGEGIYLLIAVEENTRATAAALLRRD